MVCHAPAETIKQAGRQASKGYTHVQYLSTSREESMSAASAVSLGALERGREGAQRRINTSRTGRF